MKEKRKLEYGPQATKQIRKMDKHIKDHVGKSLDQKALPPRCAIGPSQLLSSIATYRSLLPLLSFSYPQLSY